MTYQDMDRRVAATMALASLGVGPDSLVGVFMQCRMSTIVAIHGILRAGGAYVPIEPSFPIERIRFIMDDSYGDKHPRSSTCISLSPDIVLYDQVLRTAQLEPRKSSQTTIMWRAAT